MKLLFKQRLFSWLDSYDIYNEHGETAFTVEGKLAWGHKLEVLDPAGRHLGTVKEEVLTFLPRFALYLGEEYIGQIKKEFTFFKPSFTLDCRLAGQRRLAGMGLSGDRRPGPHRDDCQQGAVPLDGHLCDRY